MVDLYATLMDVYVNINPKMICFHIFTPEILF